MPKLRNRIVSPILSIQPKTVFLHKEDLKFYAMTDKFVFYAPGNGFLQPYVEREVGKSPEALAVMVSSTDIYEPDSETIIDEECALRKNSDWARLEQEFLNEYPDGYILRAAPVVGTGMKGAVRKLAEEIFSGRFFHFPGNETRKCVVHAVDIAKAVGLLLAKRPAKRVFNICDDTYPTLHDIAESLAFRMDNKRISNLSTRPQQIIARFFYRRRYAYYMTDERFCCNALKHATGFEPTDVCAYLREHVYDENSL